MRQDIAYSLIALMIIGAAIIALILARRVRRRSKGHLRVDLLKREEP